jgi:hypothetical protein
MYAVVRPRTARSLNKTGESCGAALSPAFSYGGKRERAILEEIRLQLVARFGAISPSIVGNSASGSRIAFIFNLQTVGKPRPALFPGFGTFSGLRCG